MTTQPTFWDKPEPNPKPLHAHARRTDPETSHDAADSIIADALRASQHAVFHCLGGMMAGGTDEDIAIRYIAHRSTLHWPMQSASGLRTRRCELVALGKVRDSGRRKVLDSGRQAIVWEVA